MGKARQASLAWTTNVRRLLPKDSAHVAYRSLPRAAVGLQRSWTFKKQINEMQKFGMLTGLKWSNRHLRHGEKVR